MKESESKEQLYICDHAEECDEPCVHKVKHHRSGGACCYDEGTCQLARMKVTCIPYKEEPEKEPLYICDHAEECNQNCTSGVAHIKTTGCGCNSCNFFDEPVKCIPYKEEPEGSEYIHIADGLEDEKSEPKTKRVAVLWFGEVDESVCSVLLCPHIDGSFSVNDGEVIELINPDRLRYDLSKAGDLHVSPGQAGIVMADMDFTANRCLIIDPPTEPQETVEDVLKDMPDITGYPDTPRGHQSFMENQNVGLWFKRLKAAQEVE